MSVVAWSLKALDQVLTLMQSNDAKVCRSLGFGVWMGDDRADLYISFGICWHDLGILGKSFNILRKLVYTSTHVHNLGISLQKGLSNRTFT
jgi:hypothetical protein